MFAITVDEDIVREMFKELPGQIAHIIDFRIAGNAQLHVDVLRQSTVAYGGAAGGCLMRFEERDHIVEDTDNIRSRGRGIS